MNLTQKKVLVTGADGFIGSHLVEQLVQNGCSVKAFVYYNSFNNWGWLDTISKEVLAQVEVISGDIRDSTRVREAVRGTSIIFHLASLIAIPYSYVAPRSYVDTNIIGTLNVLESSIAENIEKLLVTSTSEVYGTALSTPITEQHPLQAQSPYSATKIAADKLVESFYKSFQLPVVTVRPFNTYGPRQSARAVIPTIICQLLRGLQEIHLGDLTPRRDFTYVEDTVQGFIALAKSDKTIGETINISSNTEYSIGEVVSILASRINPNAMVVSESVRIRPKNSEVHRLIGDNTLIKNLTSWRPQYDINQGLQETINWFSKKENRCYYKDNLYNI